MTFRWKRWLVRPWQIDFSPGLLIGVMIGALVLILVLGQLFALQINRPLPITILSYLLTGAVILTWTALAPPYGFLGEKLGFRMLRRRDVAYALGGTAAIELLTLVLTTVWKVFLEWRQIPFESEQQLMLIVRNADAATFTQVFLMVAIVVPVAEELFFRRALNGVLRPLGAIPALLIGAALFSAAHTFLLGAPALFAMGAVFQLLYSRTRNLWTAVLCHATVNALALTFAYLGWNN